MPSTFITGAPGWIGTRLLNILLSGTQKNPILDKLYQPGHVRALILPGSDPSHLLDSPLLDLCSGDIRRLDDLRSFFQDGEGATVIHCAGVVHPAHRIRELYEVNVQGTQNILLAAEQSGVRRVVVLSSNSPFGSNPQRDHTFNESSPYNPYQNYGQSKMLMEQAVRQAQARGKVETVILRPCWFYGPDQPARQTTFFKMIQNGKAPIIGDGGNLRSMVYIDNLVQAILLASTLPAAAGQAYWIADRRSYSMNEITDTVERLMEQEFKLPVTHKRMHLPGFACTLAGWCDSLIQAVGLYQQKVHVLSEMDKTIACSIDKAARELGYQPNIELEEGMRRSLAWCIERGMLA